jgi:hypothetical protein
MSTPYTPTGGTQAGEFAYDYDDEHGQRLVTSAGVMLMIAAVLNTLYGIAATDKANFLVHDARYVFGDVNTWGWLLLAFGVVQFSAAFDPARRLLGPVARRRRRERQRDPADDVDPRLPILAMAILTVDIVIYGLLACGGRRSAARAACARAEGGAAS